jgi:hypothetical protein
MDGGGRTGTLAASTARPGRLVKRTRAGARDGYSYGHSDLRAATTTRTPAVRMAVTVEVQDGIPVSLSWDGCPLSVTDHLKNLRLRRLGVDLDFWQVGAEGTGGPVRIYDPQCDHGEWRLTATWC